MNLKQLEYFVQVAELGSFSQAALALGIAQPALSRQVRALETELRETLLLRNGRGVTLTQAGRRLFAHSVDLLQRVSYVLEDMGAGRDEPTGRVVIGLPPSVGRQLTVPLIEHFRTHLPNAQLAIVEGLSTHIGEWIGSGRVDVGLLHNPEAHPALQITPLLDEQLCLVEPARRRASTAGAAGKTQNGAGKSVSTDRGPLLRPALPLSRLSDYPLIMPERGHSIRRLIETRATLAGFQLDIAWEVSGIPSIIDLVCAGYGHAVLARSAVRASARASELAMRPLADPPVVSVLCCAVSAHKRPSPLVRHTTELLGRLVAGLPGT